MHLTRLTSTGRIVAGVVALALTTIMAPCGLAQSPLHGTIVDEAGKPVEGARITVRGLKQKAFSDADGQFVLAAAPTGLIVVTAQAPWAFPVVDVLRRKESDSLSFVVQRLSAREDTAVALKAEREAGRLSEVYGRAADASRSAALFTDRDIVALAPAVTTDLFIGVVGYRVTGGGFGATVTSVRDGCYPTVWVNDVEQVRFNINEIRPAAIKLLLIWNGYSLIPASLRSVRAEPTCGAVSILTK
jgi:hypothetical protein